jgi:hypothetical protein
MGSYLQGVSIFTQSEGENHGLKNQLEKRNKPWVSRIMSGLLSLMDWS